MSRAGAVVVFNLLMHRTPTFHCLERDGWHGRFPTEDGWLRAEHRTVCGEVVWANERTGSDVQPVQWRGQVERGHYIRRDHAELIGKPCRRCWP